MELGNSFLQAEKVVIQLSRDHRNDTLDSPPNATMNRAK